MQDNKKIDKNKSVFEFLKRYPDLGEDFYFNFTDETAPESVSLLTTPKKEVIKRYTDGEKLMKMTYEIALIASMSIYPDDLENLEQIKRAEEFMEWINQQGKSGIFPDFGENLKVQSITVPENIINAKLKGTGDGSAIYRFPFEILYLERN